MSQPLTGVVRRRLHDLSVHEGWFLLALADMVDSHTKEWRESWPKLTVRLGHRNQWTIRRLAYSLRDHNWLSVKSDGRGVIIILHPDRGTPTPYRCSVVANPVSYQVANPVSDQVANRVSNQVANHVAGLDTPPITPSGANAPKRLIVGRVNEDGGGEGGNGELRPASPPFAAQEKKALAPALVVPRFEPLDYQAYAWKRRAVATDYRAWLDDRERVMRQYLDLHPEQDQLADPLRKAIKQRRWEITRWISGVNKA